MGKKEETKMPMMSATKQSVQMKQRESTGFMALKTCPRKNTHNKAKGEQQKYSNNRELMTGGMFSNEV